VSAVLMHLADSTPLVEVTCYLCVQIFGWQSTYALPALGPRLTHSLDVV